MSGLNCILQAGMRNGLYPFFWQHGEAPEILADYMDQIALSGMKGVCVEARPHPEFVQDGWWRDMDLILAKAKEHGMKMWILDDSHFPTGYANGKIRDCYPQYRKQYLDMRRYDVQGPQVDARIDLKLLKGRPWDKPDPEQKIIGVCLAKRTVQETVPGDPIDAGTLTDITGQMRQSDRLLTLDVPAGAYSIFILFLTRKGEEATADYLNPLVKEATQVLIDEVYEPHYAHYGAEFGTTITGFFSDEPRFGNTKGTEAAIGTDMPLPWRDGLEDELGFEKRMLPLLWVKAQGEECSIRFQYMDVVTALYNENFTRVLGDWCRAHNVWYLGHTIEDNGAHARLGYGTGHYFRGQQDMDVAGIDVIGGQIVPGMNYHHDAFNTGGSNGEFYHYALAKLAVSAAHLDPKKNGRTMCEAFGAYGWNEGLKTMKWIADHLMVRGVNFIVPHAFDPKEFPDWDCPPHFYAHGHNPQFRYFRCLTNYMNRIMSLFCDGTYPARVGLLYPAEQEWAGAYMPVEKPARELTTHQISFDIVSRDYLKAAQVEEGAYVINGERMEVLVIPYSSHIPADMVPELSEMVENGVKILFVDKAPERTTGMEKADELLAAVREHGREVPLKKLGDALSGYRAVVLDHDVPDMVVGEYCRKDRKFYMLFNENVGEDVCAKAVFSAEGYVYRYDALADTLYEAEREDDAILIHLTPYESAVFVICQEPEPCEKPLDCTGWKTVAIPEKWAVQYADSFAYPDFDVQVSTESLGFVHQIEGFENRAGTVRFQAEMEFAGCEDAVLDLGEAHETAEVFVNGVSAGVRLCKPYQFRIGSLIQPGVNELAIEVTNTLGTAVREPVSHYLVIEPFGVQGPVTLKVKRDGNRAGSCFAETFPLGSVADGCRESGG